MARIAACYFCGTVLDDPDPHDVAGSLDVDLCADCARKLDAVLDALDDEGPADAPDDTGAPGGLDVDGVSFDAAPQGSESAPDADAGDESDGVSGVADDVAVSRADFRRVVRLLENREFPVSRSELATVADSAYDIDPDTCDAIVDAAAERGHVATDGDRIVRPE